MNGMSVEMPALRPGPLPDRFEFLIDRNTPATLRVEIRETESGALLGEAAVPVRAAPAAPIEALPVVGQIGLPVRVRGAFDGNMANTAAVVSGGSGGTGKSAAMLYQARGIRVSSRTNLVCRGSEGDMGTSRYGSV